MGRAVQGVIVVLLVGITFEPHHNKNKKATTYHGSIKPEPFITRMSLQLLDGVSGQRTSNTNQTLS
jgi:hypothetical protein